jgi:hypothetical protein
MKAFPLALVLLSAAAAPAFAGGNDPQQETNLNPVTAARPAMPPIGGFQAIRLLALETDLTPRQVRMVENTVAHDEYFRFLADKKVAERFALALGRERYADWAAGRPIQLHSPAVIEAARNMASAAKNGRGRDAEPDLRAVRVALNP